MRHVCSHQRISVAVFAYGNASNRVGTLRSLLLYRSRAGLFGAKMDCRKVAVAGDVAAGVPAVEVNTIDEPTALANRPIGVVPMTCIWPRAPHGKNGVIEPAL